jgi:hypothetical protein
MTEGAVSGPSSASGKGDLRLLLVLEDPDLDDRQECAPLGLTLPSVNADLVRQVRDVAGTVRDPSVFCRHLLSLRPPHRTRARNSAADRGL